MSSRMVRACTSQVRPWISMRLCPANTNACCA
jgi:hypothetical protein